MPSNYRILGDYIQPCNEKNLENEIPNDMLRGISNQKHFQKAKTNTIGVDLSKYRIVRKGQFAFNRATTRNGDKISIALRKGPDCIVSPSYRIFKSRDENILNSEYLMMWFRRPEFDRYARYKSHGSAHEFFDYDEMCEVELPIPSIEKQREIVNEYNTVTNRIKLNEQLNQKLEETAQALYKYWFVDFEFPNEEGKPYKSSGGEMVWNEELDKEVPKGWSVETVKDFSNDMKSGGTPSRSKPHFWNQKDIPWLKTGEIKNNIIINSREWISKDGLNGSSANLLPINTVLMSMYGVNAGEIGFLKFETTTNQACCGVICERIEESAYLYYHFLDNQEFNHSQAIGGAQQNLSKDYIENIKLLKPNNDLIYNTPFPLFINKRESLTRESQTLQELQSLLLAKMTQVETNTAVV